MASVTLEEAWFHDAEDLANSVRAVLTAASESAQRVTEVRRYAGGRLRSITGPARPGTIRVALEHADRDVVDQLRDWRGVRLLYRDPRGRVQFVVYNEIQVTELPGASVDIADVSIDLQVVSGTVEV